MAPLVDQLQGHHFTSAPPEILALNAQIIATTEELPKFFDMGVAKYREQRHAEFAHGDPARILDVSFDSDQHGGEPGAPEIEARLFFPTSVATAKPRGALLHIHGGGFTVGSARGQNDHRLLRHAEKCNMTVVSVEYRLSPEHRHPAALLDCVAASKWLDSQAGRLAAKIGADAPLLLVGESAGGSLAANLLVKLRDGGLLKFVAVALTYGWFDMSETPFFRAWGERRLVETADELRWFRSNYLGPDFPTSRMRDSDISPLYADLRGLPPALFSIGTEDALLEDSLFMYSRWLSSGNYAHLGVYPGAAHGMGHFGPHRQTTQGEQALKVLEAFYNSHL